MEANLLKKLKELIKLGSAVKPSGPVGRTLKSQPIDSEFLSCAGMSNLGHVHLVYIASVLAAI